MTTCKLAHKTVTTNFTILKIIFKLSLGRNKKFSWPTEHQAILHIPAVWMKPSLNYLPYNPVQEARVGGDKLWIPHPTLAYNSSLHIHIIPVTHQTHRTAPVLYWGQALLHQYSTDKYYCTSTLLTSITAPVLYWGQALLHQYCTDKYYCTSTVLRTSITQMYSDKPLVFLHNNSPCSSYFSHANFTSFQSIGNPHWNLFLI